MAYFLVKCKWSTTYLTIIMKQISFVPYKIRESYISSSQICIQRRTSLRCFHVSPLSTRSYAISEHGSDWTGVKVSHESYLTSYSPCWRKHAMFHNVRMVRKLALLCLCLCDIQFSYKLTRHTVRHTIAYGLLWKTFLIANGVICQQFLRVTYSLVNHWGINDEHYHLLLRHCCLSWISRLRHCDIVHSHKLWRRFLRLVVHFPAPVKLTTTR